MHDTCVYILHSLPQISENADKLQMGEISMMPEGDASFSTAHAPMPPPHGMPLTGCRVCVLLENRPRQNFPVSLCARPHLPMSPSHLLTCRVLVRADESILPRTLPPRARPLPRVSMCFAHSLCARAGLRRQWSAPRLRARCATSLPTARSPRSPTLARPLTRARLRAQIKGALPTLIACHVPLFRDSDCSRVLCVLTNPSP